MLSFKSLVPLTALFLAPALAYPSGPPHTTPTGCGEVDIFFTGLPPYHPLVISQGFDPAVVDSALRSDAAHIVAAGYNLRVVLTGPELPLSVLEDRLENRKWDGAGIGYGIRGSRLANLTIRLEEEIELFRKRLPFEPILFNYSPNTTFWAIERHFPLDSDCADSPGTDLGFEIYE